MRRIVSTFVVLVATLGFAAPASADLFTDVVSDYLKDNRLDVCQYTQEELRKIKDTVPVDQNAYTPEFIAAIDDAIARRAEGGCNKKKVTEAINQAQAPPAAPPEGTNRQTFDIPKSMRLHPPHGVTPRLSASISRLGTR